MNALLFLIPAALLIAAVFVVFFLYAVRDGQFDDLDDAPQRMLEDDDELR